MADRRAGHRKPEKQSQPNPDVCPLHRRHMGLVGICRYCERNYPPLADDEMILLTGDVIKIPESTIRPPVRPIRDRFSDGVGR
ncbi:hypothetical protein WDA79_17185 [Streptomyces sp. A475]|uniref:hypothetical protein n=1 Tax=Streptomyces sp. A475 TaxID=3131976 RepID=UPI0030C9696B